MDTTDVNEDARLNRLRELAERALERAGRRQLPDSQVKQADYDLSSAPAPIQALARSVEGMPIEDVRAECMLQFPTDSAYGPGFPTNVGSVCQKPLTGAVGQICGCDGNAEYACKVEPFTWTPEEDHRARLKLVGYAAGLALGVTKLVTDPITDVIKAATRIGIDLASRQAAARRAERMGIQAQAKRDLALQKKRKAAKAARKKNRR